MNVKDLADDTIDDPNPLCSEGPADGDEYAGLLLGEPPKLEQRLETQRVLGFAGLTALMFFEVGGGIGIEEAVLHGGIFWSLIGIIVVPVIYSLPLALFTAELATTYPSNGGQVLWANQALGPMCAFIAGAASFFANVVDATSLVVLAVDYIINLWPNDITDLKPMLQVAAVLMSTGINLRSMECVANLSLILLLFAIVPLVLLVAFSAKDLQPALWLVPRSIGVLHKGRFLNVLLWNMSGYDMVGSCAGEVENPSKVFPQALSVVLLLNTLTYLVPVAVSFCTTIGQDESKWVDGFMITGVASYVGGEWFGVVCQIFAASSAFGMATATITVASRELQYMSTIKQLPQMFAWVHPKWHTPVPAILLVAVVALTTVTFPFDELIEIATASAGIAYLIQFAVFVQLRRVPPKVDQPYVVPGGLNFAVCMLTIPVLLTMLSIVWSSLVSLCWLGMYLLAAAVYYFVRLRNVKVIDSEKISL